MKRIRYTLTNSPSLLTAVPPKPDKQRSRLPERTHMAGICVRGKDPDPKKYMRKDETRIRARLKVKDREIQDYGCLLYRVHKKTKHTVRNGFLLS
jgi:hypothetical protein